MLETMKTNWKRVYEQLKDDPPQSSPYGYAEEKKVLRYIEKNVYHRKTETPYPAPQGYQNPTMSYRGGGQWGLTWIGA